MIIIETLVVVLVLFGLYLWYSVLQIGKQFVKYASIKEYWLSFKELPDHLKEELLKTVQDFNNRYTEFWYDVDKMLTEIDDSMSKDASESEMILLWMASTENLQKFTNQEITYKELLDTVK